MATFKSESGLTVYDASKKRTLTIDGVVYKRVPKERPKSRAARLADAVTALRNIVQKLEDLKGEAENTGELCDNDRLEAIEKEATESVSFIDLGEIEELKGEMETWRENIEEHFSGTDKYERVSEAADNLENAISELESVSYNEVFSASEVAEDNAEAIVEALQETIDAIEEQASELDNVEFPGMFG